jgi:hypothetical protein
MLDEVLVTVNKNVTLRYLKSCVTSASGSVRLLYCPRHEGTEMGIIAELIDLTLSSGFESKKAEIIEKAKDLTKRFPLY